MSRRKKTTDWPEGFEAYIRGRQFTDVEELLLWDCAIMHECLEEAMAKWKALEGSAHESEMRAEEWKAVRGLADEISVERTGAPMRMYAIRWGCALAGSLEQRFLAQIVSDARTL